MANFFTEVEDIKFHLSHPLMEKIVRLKEGNFEEEQNFDFAPHDFEDTIDSYNRILEIVGEICETTIAPNAESVDAEGPHLENNEVTYAEGTQKNYDALVKAGLIGMTLPRKYDGLNFPITPYVMAGEMISRADAGFANIWGLQDCAETIYEFGDDEIKSKYLPQFNQGATAAMDLTEPDAGSDLQAVQLKATFDDSKNQWLLNGVKRFITNGDADLSLVLARSEEGSEDARGLSLFLYDRNEHAVSVRRIERKLGIKGSPTCELVFNDAPAYLIGSERMGLIKYVMSLMNSARLGVGGQSVGIAEAAYREALKYAQERSQFGKPIIQFPAVYEMLTNMKVNITALRSLLYETSRMIDIYKGYQEISKQGNFDKEMRMEMKSNNRNADVFTPMLKLVASECSNQIAYDALQIHGGAGFMKDFPVERLYRDARITTIYEGTSQLQVVAAIKGVLSGTYLKKIQEYELSPVRAELEYLRHTLKKMTDLFEATVESVKLMESEEFVDFHARRLVEMAANIIMGHLMVLDAERATKYKYLAEVFIKKGQSDNLEKASYIENSEIKDLGTYRQIALDHLNA